MTTNDDSGNHDSRFLNNRSYDTILEQYVSDKKNGEKLIDNIYIYIGAVVIFLFILYIIVMMIEKCVKNCQTVTQSNATLTEVSVIQRHSSIRNPLASNHRSSLSIGFLMEIQERRISQSYLIPLTIQKI